MWIVSADLKLNLAVYSPLWLFLFLGIAYAVAYLIFRFWSEPMNHWIRSEAICIFSGGDRKQFRADRNGKQCTI